MYSVFNNVLGNLALRTYLCKKKRKEKKYATCEEGTRGPEGLLDCWEADLCGLSSLSRMRITLWEFIS